MPPCPPPTARLPTSPTQSQPWPRVAQAGADIVLSGHTHMPHAGFAETAAGVLFLQVGTAISTRLKTGTNDFALVTLGPGEVTVESWLSPRGSAGFTPGPDPGLRPYGERPGRS